MPEVSPARPPRRTARRTPADGTNEIAPSWTNGAKTEWAKEAHYHPLEVPEITGTCEHPQREAVHNPVQSGRKPTPESPLGKVLALVAALAVEDRRWLTEYLRKE